MASSIALSLLTVAAAPACTGVIEGGPETGDQGNPVTAEACSPSADSIQRTIIQQSCNGAACHGTETGVRGLDLVSGSLEGLVGESAITCSGWALVVPGSPERSFLYHKVSEGVPACGDHMPIGLQLSRPQIACISQWISGLAGSGCETCGGASCITLASDPANCGACGNVCPAAIACQNGACQCSAGMLSCASVCVDVDTDPTHCGSCGVACSPGATCAAGVCMCPAPLAGCEGVCADLQVDGLNCGACGNTCAANQVCLLGACSSDCGTLMRCGDSCVDTQTNVLHCGACDQACPGGLLCSGGKCSCPAAGETLCGTSCADLQTNTANCGACGKLCGAGEACIGGVCKCVGTGTVSFQDDIEPIFSASCTGSRCHSGSQPAAGLSLATGQAYGQLVNVSAEQCGDRVRVTPGDPATSYLMQKLVNLNLCSGTKMPTANTSLPEQDLDAINDWICSGAENN